VNADEGEPATFKDHMLIERDPHQIVEGSIISAYAIERTTRSSTCGASSHSARIDCSKPSTTRTPTGSSARTS